MSARAMELAAGRSRRTALVLSEHRHDWESDQSAIARLLDEHDGHLLVLLERPLEITAPLRGQGRLSLGYCG